MSPVGKRINVARVEEALEPFDGAVNELLDSLPRVENAGGFAIGLLGPLRVMRQQPDGIGRQHGYHAC